MKFFKFLKPFFATRKRRKQLRKQKRQTKRHTKKQHKTMRGGWGESFVPVTQPTNIMRGGWGGAVPPFINNI